MSLGEKNIPRLNNNIEESRVGVFVVLSLNCFQENLIC